MSGRLPLGEDQVAPPSVERHTCSPPNPAYVAQTTFASAGSKASEETNPSRGRVTLHSVDAVLVVAPSERTIWPPLVPPITRSALPGATAIAEIIAGKGMLARFQVAALLSVRHIDVPPV